MPQYLAKDYSDVRRGSTFRRRFGRVQLSLPGPGTAAIIAARLKYGAEMIRRRGTITHFACIYRALWLPPVCVDPYVGVSVICELRDSLTRNDVNGLSNVSSCRLIRPERRTL